MTRKELNELIEKSKKEFNLDIILKNADRIIYNYENSGFYSSFEKTTHTMWIGTVPYEEDDFLAIYKIQKMYESGKIDEEKYSKLINLYQEEVIFSEAYDRLDIELLNGEMEEDISLLELEEKRNAIYQQLKEYNLHYLGFQIHELFSQSIKAVIDDTVSFNMLETIIETSEVLRKKYNMDTNEIVNSMSQNANALLPFIEKNASGEDFEHLAQKTHNYYESKLKVKTLNNK